MLGFATCSVKQARHGMRPIKDARVRLFVFFPPRGGGPPRRDTLEVPTDPNNSVQTAVHGLSYLRMTNCGDNIEGVR